MTNQQKQKIYLEAAKYFSKLQNKDYWHYYEAEGFCDFVQNKKRINCSEFQEYQLFKPKVVKPYSYWFDVKKENKIEQTDRVYALLLAAEMCND